MTRSAVLIGIVTHLALLINSVSNTTIVRLNGTSVPDNETVTGSDWYETTTIQSHSLVAGKKSPVTVLIVVLSIGAAVLIGLVAYCYCFLFNVCGIRDKKHKSSSRSSKKKKVHKYHPPPEQMPENRVDRPDNQADHAHNQENVIKPKQVDYTNNNNQMNNVTNTNQTKTPANDHHNVIVKPIQIHEEVKPVKRPHKPHHVQPTHPDQIKHKHQEHSPKNDHINQIHKHKPSPPKLIHVHPEKVNAPKVAHKKDIKTEYVPPSETMSTYFNVDHEKE